MNLKQHRFVTEYLRHRDAMTAYSIAYNYETSDYASLQSAANRLMNHPEVSAAIYGILEGIRHDVEQEIRAELKVELLTIQRKREILAKIAAGEFYAVHNYKGKDCNMCTQHVWPTINQVLKAIDLDNKMAGLYTATQASHGKKQYTRPAADGQLHRQVDKFITSLGGAAAFAIHEPMAGTATNSSTDPVSPTAPLPGNKMTGTAAPTPFPPVEKPLESQQNTTISHKGLRRLSAKTG